MMDVSKLFDPEKGALSGLVYTDEEVYQQELERLWARTWVFLAHDSMLPKAGSYIQTYIGEDPIVVVRQKDKSVKAFLNQCRHRGMRICRADRGVAKAFMCSFHGWAYDIGGNLRWTAATTSKPLVESSIVGSSAIRSSSPTRASL